MMGKNLNPVKKRTFHICPCNCANFFFLKKGYNILNFLSEHEMSHLKYFYDHYYTIVKAFSDDKPIIYQLRSEVNKVLENARTGKLIGSSLEAKVYLYASCGATATRLQEMCTAINDADALHKILITSQVGRTLTPFVCSLTIVHRS